jgi:hypothetical protein
MNTLVFNNILLFNRQAGTTQAGKESANAHPSLLRAGVLTH